MDDKTQDKIIDALANSLWYMLRLFPPAQRLWILAEISNRVTRRLRSRESSRYAIDFSSDEPPTKPSVDKQHRETRAINIDALNELREKSKKDDNT